MIAQTVPTTFKAEWYPAAVIVNEDVHIAVLLARVIKPLASGCPCTYYLRCIDWTIGGKCVTSHPWQASLLPISEFWTVSHAQLVLQSRSQLTAEAENVLSELTHGFTLVAMSTTQSSHAAQAKAMELLSYSREMLSRLSR